MVKTQTATVAADKKPATVKAKGMTVQAAAESTKAPAAKIAKKAAAPAAAVKKPLPAAKTAKSDTSPKPSEPKPAKEEKPAKAKKVKLVRDSFTMPEPEYLSISMLKDRCLKSGVAAKKSEILRAAVASLAELSDVALLAAVRRLKVIKTGRPAKGHK